MPRSAVLHVGKGNCDDSQDSATMMATTTDTAGDDVLPPSFKL